MFKEWDKNGDGVLEKNEVPPGPRKIFEKKDANGDGKISMAEHLGREGKPAMRPDRPGDGNSDAAFSIGQTWDQEPQGFDRPVYVSEPGSKRGRVPVVIFFHGAGGNAGGQIKNWAQLFPDRLVVAPQGYRKGWNIQGEDTNAPDIEFFKAVIAELEKRYDYADMDNVSLIGSSNGAAYIYRIMIEVGEDLFRNAVPMVSSLLEVQYNSDTFWMPSGDTDHYDTEADPVGGRRILYLHGTEDRVVPFDGGLRGRFEHLSALETALIWAREQGYAGEDIDRNDGKDLGDGLTLYEYAGSNVTFVAVEESGHGLQPHRDAAMDYIQKFLNQ